MLHLEIQKRLTSGIETLRVTWALRKHQEVTASTEGSQIRLCTKKKDIPRLNTLKLRIYDYFFPSLGLHKRVAVEYLKKLCSKRSTIVHGG